MEFRQNGGLELIDSIGGSVVQETTEFPKSHRRYELTLLGILLTNRGPEYEKLLDRFVKYACRQVEADPELDQLTSDEVREGIGLDDQESRELETLLWTAHAFGGGGSHSESSWTITVPDEIEELIGEDNVLPYIEGRALRNYDPDAPVEGEARTAFLSTKVSEDMHDGVAEGWDEVNRRLDRMQEVASEARGPEDHQAVGLLARGLIIALAETVHDPDSQPSLDGVEMSAPDARRRLEAYVEAAMPGESGEEIRRVCKATLVLANGLVHRQTADACHAALCQEATTATVNLLAIIHAEKSSKVVPVAGEGRPPRD